MRSKFFIVISVLLLLVISSYAQKDSDPPLTFEKISDRLFITRGGGSGTDAGIYFGDNSVLMIDSRMEEGDMKKVFDWIDEKTDNPLKYLINTHSDHDHIYGNRYFPPSVTIISHENCRDEFLKPEWDGSPSIWSDPELAPFFPTMTFRKKLVLHFGGSKVELRYFGAGHTSGDAVIYFPEEKAAFIGDQLMIGNRPGCQPYKGGNAHEHINTLSKMLFALDAERFYNGHGGREFGREDVRKYISEMGALIDEVKALIRSGKNLEQIKAEYDPDIAMLIRNIYEETGNK